MDYWWTIYDYVTRDAHAGHGQTTPITFTEVGYHTVKVQAGATRPAVFDTCGGATDSLSRYIGQNVQFKFNADWAPLHETADPCISDSEVDTCGQDQNAADSQSVVCVELTGIQVNGDYEAPNTTPRTYAVPIGNGNDGNPDDDYVVLTAEINPATELPEGAITWTCSNPGMGEAVPNDPTRYRVKRTSVHASDVTATAFGQPNTVKIVVCKVTGLTSDACSVDAGNGVTAVDPGGNNYVIVTAQMDTAGVDVSVVYDQIIRWTGGAPGAMPGTRNAPQHGWVERPPWPPLKQIAASLSFRLPQTLRHSLPSPRQSIPH